MSADNSITIELRSESEAETRVIATALARRLRGGELLALHGQLGAGKTCFVRGLAEGLGIAPGEVSSPTFVICQEYGGAQTPLRLVHIDAYRLSSAEELETIGWSELREDRGSVVAVEWPGRVAAALPAERIDVHLDHLGPTARGMVIVAGGAFANRLQGFAPPRQRSPRCRVCGRAVDAASKFLPFCSERCRLADLGRWFNESYRVSRAPEVEEES